MLGPAAKAAVPPLVQAFKGKDARVRAAAVGALGKIHSDPDDVIPLLMGCLDDDDLNDHAALALGRFGALSKAAIPKLIPLLNGSGKEIRYAARVALKQIDPVAAAKAGVR
jgi:HEAT repeat protein